MQIKAILLDRDGVINKKREDYVKSWDEFEFLEHSVDALKLFSQNGLKLIIVTNQSVINRKIISLDTLNEIHSKMKDSLKEFDIFIDEIFFCPHRPNENCDCRKPKPGLLKSALEKFQLLPENCVMIGDSDTDVEAGLSLGIKSILSNDDNLLKIAKSIIDEN